MTLNSIDSSFAARYEGEGEGGCECNKFEDYCWFSECGSSCKNSIGGCGTLWSRECDGVCVDE